MYDGVTVSVLTGRSDHLWRKKNHENKESVIAGDVFAADLEQLNAELQASGRAAPSILLMGESARVYHDRFLVVDDAVWHFGHSFNQIGDASVSMAIRLSHPDEIRTLICEDVGNAAPFLATWPSLKARREATQPGLWRRIWACMKACGLLLRRGAT
jgi:hypothetical protein